MKADLYSYVGVFSRGLQTLSHLLAKGEEFAKAKGGVGPDILEWRLAEDMYPLRFQAQTVIRISGAWSARAAGVETPPDPESAMTLEELRAAIADVQARLAAFKPEQFAGRDAQAVTFNIGAIEPTLPVGQWLPGFALPNFFFHLSMTYAILRNRGVELGKRDFFAGGL